MMKNHLMMPLELALGLLFAIALPSCLQHETTINLNKDGSGTIVEETYLTAAMLEISAQFAQPGAPDPVAEVFTEEKSKARAPKLGEGVEFVKMELIEKNGNKGARSTYKFADINAVAVNPSSAMENLGDQAPGAGKEENSLKFKYADGRLELIIPPTDFGQMAIPKQAGEENPHMEEMMKQMIADMRIAIRIAAPGGIAETNASFSEGDTVTLFDLSVGKMFAQKEELMAIAETAKTDKDAAIVEFKKLEGMSIETSEVVSITLK